MNKSDYEHLQSLKATSSELKEVADSLEVTARQLNEEADTIVKSLKKIINRKRGQF
jgi:ABC-type transporter Mla subunit MlaD